MRIRRKDKDKEEKYEEDGQSMSNKASVMKGIL